MADAEGYRHLFASIPGDGEPGFQTAAAAADLDRQVLRELEARVGRFPLRGRPGERSRQVLRYDPEGRYTLLTTFTLLGTGPDGRPGNYLAESLLVPNAWLAGFHWDFAAAFAAAEWWGPDALERISRPQLDLAAEELPAPRPGDLARLSVLAGPAAGGQLDRLLLGMVRAASGRGRLAVVEADDRRPQALDELVALLPLTVPPVCRRQPASGGAGDLALTLRTRGPAQGMPEATVIGVVDADRGDAEGPGCLVVDLAGQLPADEIVDTEAYEYAQWVGQAIRDGGWPELAGLYAAAEEEPDGRFFRRFPDLRRRLAARPAAAAEATGREGRPAGASRKRAALPAAPPTSVPPVTAAPAANPVAAWDREVAGRRAGEAAAAEAHDGLRDELETLKTALREENDRARQELAAALETWRPTLREAFTEERKRFLEQVEREIEAEGLAAQKRLQQEAGRMLKHVRKEGDAMLAAWGQGIAQRQHELAEPEAGGASPRGLAWFRDSSRGRRWALAGAGALLAVVLFGGGWMARGWLAAGDERAETVDGDGTTSVAEADLVARLRHGEAAAALLARAAEEPSLAPTAAAAGAALLLDEATLGDAERCVLLQTALRRRAPAGGGSPLGVDGDCQAGTWTALARAVADGSCCADLPGAPPPTRRVACFLGEELGVPSAERCDGPDPWSGERDWSAEEAGRFLELLGDARRAAGEGARQHLPAADAYDVRSASARAAIRELEPSESDARELLGLARQLAGGSSASPADLQALLDGLTAPGATEGVTETSRPVAPGTTAP